MPCSSTVVLNWWSLCPPVGHIEQYLESFFVVTIGRFYWHLVARSQGQHPREKNYMDRNVNRVKAENSCFNEKRELGLHRVGWNPYILKLNPYS